MRAREKGHFEKPKKNQTASKCQFFWAGWATILMKQNCISIAIMKKRISGGMLPDEQPGARVFCVIAGGKNGDMRSGEGRAWQAEVV